MRKHRQIKYALRYRIRPEISRSHVGQIDENIGQNILKQIAHELSYIMNHNIISCLQNYLEEQMLDMRKNYGILFLGGK